MGYHMASSRDETIIKINEITNELSILSRSISEIDFIRNPANAVPILNKRLDEKIELKKEILSRMEMFRNEFEGLSENINAQSGLDEINKIEEKINNEMKKIKTIEDSENEIKSLTHKYQNDDNYKKYHDLFLKRFFLQRSIGTESSSDASNIKALLNYSATGSLNLISNMANILSDKKKWYDGFSRIHRYELSSKEDGSNITVSRDTVSCSNEITADNMKTVIPAMIAIYLKSTDGVGIVGCTFYGFSPEATQYFEEMLANELMKRSSCNAGYTVNDIKVEDIIARQTKKETITESIEPDKTSFRCS